MLSSNAPERTHTKLKRYARKMEIANGKALHELYSTNTTHGAHIALPATIRLSKIFVNHNNNHNHNNNNNVESRIMLLFVCRKAAFKYVNVVRDLI